MSQKGTRVVDVSVASRRRRFGKPPTKMRQDQGKSADDDERQAGAGCHGWGGCCHLRWQNTMQPGRPTQLFGRSRYCPGTVRSRHGIIDPAVKGLPRPE